MSSSSPSGIELVDEQMPHHSSNDGIDEDAINQAEIQLKRFRCYLVCAGVVSFVFGAAVGVVVALNRSESAGNSSGDECAMINPANTGCIVPECARIKYEELKAMYPALPDCDVTTGRSIADDDDCPPDHLAANALAIRWTNTNNADEIVDANVYFALATFYFSLSGEKWNSAENWLQPSPVCEWHGINCTKDKDDMKDVIVAISLPDNQLVGGIPTQLGLLTTLQSLNLAGNNLGGTSMPSEIGRLVDLETLDLQVATLAGQLPSEIGLCTKLKMLDVWGSDMTGTVPTEIGNIKSLESLEFGSAVLAGPLPTEIGHLSRLTALSIDFLLATEVIMIPSEVSLLSNIRHLYVVGIVIPSDTWLTDSLVAMTGLTWLHIASQRVSTKQKSSTLPTQIGLLTTLVSISLFNAGIAGTLPTEFARLTKLTFLELWSNDLSGTVPTEIGLLTDLVVLNLPDNPMLTGFVPSEVGALTNLSKLDFQGTSISVQFPPEVCALGVEVTMSELDKDVDACK